MEVCATVSSRKWGTAFDSIEHTSNRSTHASVQDPCLPISDNCVPRKADKVCGGIRWSLAAEHPHTLEYIWFTDEAYFHLTGDINRQNVRFWGTQHSHQIHESTLHAQKVLVCCAVSAQGLIGSFMFNDSVTGENYVMMLDSFFLPQLRRRRCSLHAQLFQQDGARPHTTLQRSWDSCTPSSSIA